MFKRIQVWMLDIWSSCYNCFLKYMFFYINDVIIDKLSYEFSAILFCFFVPVLVNSKAFFVATTILWPPHWNKYLRSVLNNSILFLPYNWVTVIYTILFWSHTGLNTEIYSVWFCSFKLPETTYIWLNLAMMV